MGVVQHWKKKSDKWTKLRNNIVGHEQNHAQPNRFFPEWNTVFLVSCVLAVSLDPLFLYIPIINEDRKCLKYDKRLKAISFGLRLLADLFYMADVVYRILTRPKAKEAVPLKASNSVNSRTTLQFYILLDILAVLPVPQVSLKGLWSRLISQFLHLSWLTTLGCPSLDSRFKIWLKNLCYFCPGSTFHFPFENEGLEIIENNEVSKFSCFVAICPTSSSHLPIVSWTWEDS